MGARRGLQPRRPATRHVRLGQDRPRIWDPTTGAEILSSDRYGASISGSITFSPDGKALALGGTDHTVRIWDSATGREQFVIRGHKKPLHSIAFGPDGTSLVTGSADGTAKVWDLEAADRSHELRQDGLIMGVAFGPDGRRVATVSGDGTAAVWDAVRGTRLHSLDGKKGWLNGVAFHPDGGVIATACEYASVLTWDATTRPPHAQLRRAGPLRTGRTIQSRRPAPRRVYRRPRVSRQPPGSVYVWDARSGAMQFRLRGHPGRVLCLAFSPDSRLIASGGAPHDPRPLAAEDVLLWSARSGEIVHRLRGHSGRVNGVAFSGDGKWLAAACEDGAVRLWDVAKGSLVRSLGGFSEAKASHSTPKATVWQWGPANATSRSGTPSRAS